jgi:hypothetical protein
MAAETGRLLLEIPTLSSRLLTEPGHYRGLFAPHASAVTSFKLNIIGPQKGN